MHSRWLHTILVALLLALAGCAEAELAAHAVKSMEGAKGPPKVGSYKIGKPYQVAGRWYYPKEDFEYDETGIASWYGPGFDGKTTANGEIFDRYRLTAAHRTLPLPSVVRVINLENGRSIKMRVNDRGPFAKNRIIDVSWKAADLLGFVNQGTAKVRVQILPAESRQVAAEARGEDAPATAVPREPVAVVALDGEAAGRASDAPQELPAPRAAAEPQPLDLDSSPEVTRLAVAPTDIFVQVGAFSVEQNALRLQRRLSSYSRAAVSPVQVAGVTLYRVRIGPLAAVSQADRMVSRLEASGIEGAQIIVE